MTYRTLHPKVFGSDESDDWKSFLEDEGYVVIGNILSEEKRTQFFQMFKEDFATISPDFNTEDKDTWTIDTYPGMFGKGMCVFEGLGQSNFSWLVRTDETVNRIYQSIFRTDDLVTSLDGCSVFVSTKQQGKSWHHIDENPQNPILCYQGAYNYFGVGEDDAGFVVAPTSHRSYKPEVKHKKDWIMVEDDSEWHQKGVKLCIPENCFTLWNSRLIHANTGIHKKKPVTEINRLTVYATLMPRYLSSEKNREERVKAYRSGDACSHWANKCEIKRYPWGFGPRHKKKNLFRLEPKLIEGEIPPERLAIL